jgi:hypothetical protein
VTNPHTVTQEALMLFAPQMAQMLATSAKRRPRTSAAPRTRATQRIFSVVSARKALRMPRIQKRTTTCGSLQPFTSK